MIQGGDSLGKLHCRWQSSLQFWKLINFCLGSIFCVGCLKQFHWTVSFQQKACLVKCESHSAYYVHIHCTKITAFGLTCHLLQAGSLCSSNAITEVLTDCTWSVKEVISSDGPECCGDSQTLWCFQEGERSGLVFRPEKCGCTHLWAPLTSAVPCWVRAEVPDCPTTTDTNDTHGCGQYGLRSLRAMQLMPPEEPAGWWLQSHSTLHWQLDSITYHAACIVCSRISGYLY